MNGWSSTTLTAGALALVVVLLVALAVALVRSRARTKNELDAARSAQEELLRRIELLERPDPAFPDPGSDSLAEFVITDVGSTSAARSKGAPEAPTRIEGRLFVDIIARETVVKAASWTFGLRHALSAENRNRLRFEMRRETKRAAKQRKADVKEALRQYYANQSEPTLREGPDEEDVA